MDTFKKNGINKADISLTSITPFISHGEKELEFRFPELKSAMRFWWRALCFFENAQNMWEKEGEYFGTQGKKSPVVFIPKTCKKIYVYDDNPTKKISFNAEIEFTMKYPQNDYINYLDLLEFVSYVGGIGRNSSKGDGSFQIEESSIHSIGDAVDLQNRIFDLANAIYNTSEKKEIPIYKNFHNKIIFKRKPLGYAHLSEITIGKEMKYENFIDKIGDINREALNNDSKFGEMLKINRNPILYISCVKVSENIVIPVINKMGYCGKNFRKIKDNYNNYCNAFSDGLREGGKSGE